MEIVEGEGEVEGEAEAEAEAEGENERQNFRAILVFHKIERGGFRLPSRIFALLSA